MFTVKLQSNRRNTAVRHCTTSHSCKTNLHLDSETIKKPTENNRPVLHEIKHLQENLYVENKTVRKPKGNNTSGAAGFLLLKWAVGCVGSQMSLLYYSL